VWLLVSLWLGRKQSAMARNADILSASGRSPL
jgi:hypothetical protein